MTHLSEGAAYVIVTTYSREQLAEEGVVICADRSAAGCTYTAGREAMTIAPDEACV